MIRILLLTLFFAPALHAVEVAPRISDREIIEALTEIKVGQKALNQRFDDIQRENNQRFESINQRFESIGQRFDDMQRENNQRFESIGQRFDNMQRETNQRFDDMQRENNQRFNSLESTMLTLFTAMIMLIVALFGYIAWDRRTALKPLEREVQNLRREVERDLDLRAPEGSMLTRAVQALRELSKDDPKIASVLRTYSLL